MGSAFHQYSMLLDHISWACGALQDDHFYNATASLPIPDMHRLGLKRFLERLSNPGMGDSCDEVDPEPGEVVRCRRRRRKKPLMPVKPSCVWQELVYKVTMSTAEATTIMPSYLIDVLTSRTEQWSSWHDIVWHLLTSYNHGSLGVFRKFINVCNETESEQNADVRREARQRALMQDMQHIEEGPEFVAFSKAVRALTVYKASLAFYPQEHRDLLAGKDLPHLPDEHLGSMVGVPRNSDLTIYVSSDFARLRNTYGRWRKEGHKLTYLTALLPPGLVPTLLSDLYSTRSSGKSLLSSLKLRDGSQYVRKMTNELDGLWGRKARAISVMGGGRGDGPESWTAMAAAQGVVDLEGLLSMHQLDSFWDAVNDVAQAMATEILR